MPYSPLLSSPSTGVIVTGGASGIGLAAAHALAAVGRPVALWDISAEAAGKAAKEIAGTHGVAAGAVAVDLRDQKAVTDAVAESRRILPTIGGLVHSAGTAETTGLDGVTPENWNAGLALHVHAIIAITQSLRDDFRANRNSAIVALASMNASLGSGLIPIYSAAKGAVLSLVRSMADELAADGVRINAVSPGVIRTPMVEKVRENLPEGFFERRVFLGRLGEPHEVGRLIRFLMSEEASYITAQEFVVDGGNIPSAR